VAQNSDRIRAEVWLLRRGAWRRSHKWFGSREDANSLVSQERLTISNAELRARLLLVGYTEEIVDELLDEVSEALSGSRDVGLLEMLRCQWARRAAERRTNRKKT